jgi:glycosyltransferase involved in cell wall biosynthesis
VSAVTVLVPVKDRRERMLRCLDALLAQDHPSYDIIVLDNGSTDGTLEACSERAATTEVPLRVERIDGTVGRVRNTGARLASAPLIAYTDSDCIPAPQWLSEGVKPFADQRVGIVCGRTEPEEPISRAWGASLDVPAFSGRYESCNVLFRRDAFVESAGFDEDVGHYWEDTAAGFAVRRGGWEARFADAALVRHDVTYPGYWWWVRRALKNANVGAVVARYPEVRDELLWGRVFLQERDALYLLLLAGAMAAPRRPLTAVLALPYVIRRRPGMVAGRPRLKGMAQTLLFDGASIAGTVRGAIRSRVFLL